MQKIGKLSCIDVSGPADAASEEALTLVFFHGFGADAYDLQTLSEALHVKKAARFVFPQGPLEVPIGPGWTGRAWWHIDLMALQEAAMRGELRDMGKLNPPGLSEAREKALDMLNRLGVPMNQIVLGGFSQGAMLATDVYLHAPSAPKGLVIFSGSILNKEEWSTKISERKGERFFLSHGLQDPVLPARGAQQLESFLCGGGMKGHLLSFQGTHEIPPAVIARASEYLNSL